MKDVSVIIVNYNTAVLTVQCISSVLRHTAQLDYEIIVVDNHSEEQAINNVPIAFPFVKFIRLDENIGFGKANNIAVQQAKGKYLFLLNPDTIIRNDALQFFYDFYEANAERLALAAVGTELTDMHGNMVHSFHQFPTIDQYLVNKCKSLLARIGVRSQEKEQVIHTDNFYQVDYVTGADLFISKQLFNNVGGFDADYFLYFEESDLQCRLYQKSRYSYIIQGPLIVHLQGQSTTAINRKAQVLYLKSMMCYMKKHNSALMFNLFRILWIPLDIKTVTWQLMLWVKSKRF